MIGTNLMYSWQCNEMWYTDRVDTFGIWNTYTYCGLVIDENGYAHISYNPQLASSGSLLKYARGKPDTLGVEVLPKISKPIFMFYPTVVKSKANIIYSLKEGSDVSISIYDLGGRKIKEVVRGERSCGEYIEWFDTSTLNNGIYFCRTKTKDYLGVKKFIVVK